MRTEQRTTTMALALTLAALKLVNKGRHTRLVSAVANSKQGTVKFRGWDAKVSFKTAQKLKQQGILAP